jgi:hypothetical protein
MRMSEYRTWYEFKQDLERHVGHCVVNTDWLRVKPASPLPWDVSRLHATIRKLGRIQKRHLLDRAATN